MSHIDDGDLHAYLDAACGERRRDAITAHLATCSECRERLEAARSVAARASSLLAELEPGPVHSPAWQELEGRAVAGAERPARRVVPLWRRPGLAWAASIVLAFGLGWLARSQDTRIGARSSVVGDMPADERDASPSREAERLTAAPRPQSPAAAGDAATERADTANAAVADRDAGAATRRKSAAAAAEPELSAATGVGAEPPPTSAGRTGEFAYRLEPPVGAGLPTVDETTVQVGQQATGAPQASPPAAATAPGQQPAPGTGTTPTGPLPKPATTARYEEQQALPEITVTGTSPMVDGRASFGGRGLDELRAGRSVFEAGRADAGFVVVPFEEATLWLGAPPRSLPDLTLMSAEVAPGAVVAGGIAERPALRLTYEDATGQRIVLTQQYIGAAIGSPALAAEADAPAFARKRAEAEVAGAAFRDAALIVAPDGRAGLRWTDAAGYVLHLSGGVDADVLRGLADRVR